MAVPLHGRPLVAAAVMTTTVMALAVPFAVSRAFHMFTALPVAVARAPTVNRHASGANIDMLSEGGGRPHGERRGDQTGE
ncbi:hypothetical protein [Methylobacterium sp. ID0610]|uniref:hypothetical protein n=1 Tax=Methylobacterium carpenticola TaxID=3344827 RepID=UPI00368A1864